MILFLFAAFAFGARANEMPNFPICKNLETFEAVQEVIDCIDDCIERGQKNNWLHDGIFAKPKNERTLDTRCISMINSRATLAIPPHGIALHNLGYCLTLVTPWGNMILLQPKFYPRSSSDKETVKSTGHNIPARACPIPADLCLLSSLCKRLTLRLHECEHAGQGAPFTQLIKDITFDTNAHSIENRDEYIQVIDDPNAIKDRIGTNTVLHGNNQEIYEVTAIDGKPLPEIQQYDVALNRDDFDSISNEFVKFNEGSIDVYNNFLAQKERAKSIV